MPILSDGGVSLFFISLISIMSYYYQPKQGKKTITTAGTAEALVSNSTPCKTVTIQALLSNTGKVYVGTSSVSSTTYGVVLSAGETFSLSNEGHDSRIDLSTIYIDVDTNGEGVTFFYM